jgi:plasmid replication initiation protein
MENDKQLPQNNESFKKSNVLISAQFKWGNFETSILNLALAKMNKGEATEDEYGIKRNLVIHMYEIPGFKSGSSNTYIYKKVDKASDVLQNAKINIQYKDEHGHQSFEKIVVFPYAHYEDGKLTLAFSPEIISRKLANPLENYTKILLTSELFGNSESTTKLYENLKRYCYYPYRVEDHYEWLVTVRTLRCLMGLIDTNQKEFKTAMDKLGDSYNVDIVVKELEEKDAALLRKRQEEENRRYGDKARKVRLAKGEPKAPYADFRNFRRVVLEPAIKMINEKADIQVTYTQEQLSVGGEVNALKFCIYNQGQVKNLTYEEKRKRIVEVDKVLIGEDMQAWTTEMIGDLLEIADYDAELVKAKYRLLQSQKAETIRNRFAWLKSAIDGDYNNSTASYVDEPVEQSLFERLWAEYPKKSRLDKITKKQKSKLEGIGYDEMHKAITNYINFVESCHKNGFNRAYLGGGIFFSGEYERWLEANYEATLKEESFARAGNKFINFEQDEVDYDEIAKQKIAKRMKRDDK